jgi:hypothetical protein
MLLNVLEKDVYFCSLGNETQGLMPIRKCSPAEPPLHPEKDVFMTTFYCIATL